MSKASFRNIVLSFILVSGIIFSIVWNVYATAPNPGHNFTEVGGGTLQGDILYGSAADTLSALAKNATASRYLSNSGASNNPAWAQVDLTNGVTSALPILNGGTSQTTAAAARGSSGLNIDQMTGHGDSIYTILSTDRVVVTNAAFTASRTWTLPAANAINAGQTICVYDLQGTVTSTNTLIIARAGADTIDGATSLTFANANDGTCLTSDGTSKWAVAKHGLELGGTGSALTASNGGICYSTASALAVLAGTATANKVLMSGASGAPSWSTPTFPNASATTRKIIVSDGTNWLASTETYAVPGTAGNLMESDGTNWTSVVGGVLIARQTLTSGTTYTPTTGTHEAMIELWGGGGAGGSCSAVAGCASGGGGSGGYARFFLTGVSGTFTIAIGGGGAASAGATGGAGGNTTFNTGATTITAFGGAGGTTAAGTAATKYTAGGAGGVVSTNGQVNGAGMPGEFGSTSATATIGATGNGGSTSLGGGGVGKTYSSAAAVVGAAAIANTGSGGSGGGTGTTTVAAGGAGAAGVIIISEYR